MSIIKEVDYNTVYQLAYKLGYRLVSNRDNVIVNPYYNLYLNSSFVESFISLRDAYKYLLRLDNLKGGLDSVKEEIKELSTKDNKTIKQKVDEIHTMLSILITRMDKLEQAIGRDGYKW